MTEKIPQIENKFEKIEKIIKALKNYKDNFIEDLPEQLITMDDPDYYRYKCRTNWWHHLLAELGRIDLYPHLFKKETFDKNKEFMDFIEGLDYEKFRTKNEIDKANIFLGELVSCLEEEKLNK